MEITTGVEDAELGESLMTFTSIAVTDNAVYNCLVKYHASVTTLYDWTGSYLAQFVRSIDTGVNGTQYASKGSAVTLTCIVYGDVTLSVNWTNTEGELSDSVYTPTTWPYNTWSFSTTSKLEISSMRAEDATSFTCEAKYKAGESGTKKLKEVIVLEMNFDVGRFDRNSNFCL